MYRLIIKARLPIVLFYLFFLIAFVYSQDKDHRTSTVEADYKNFELNIYEVFNSNKTLIRKIDFSDYQSNLGYSQSENYVYLVRKNGKIIRIHLRTGELESLPFRTDGAFQVSFDDRFLCTAQQIEILTKRINGHLLTTKIPVVYDIENKNEVEITKFAYDFLLEEIGIDLRIRFNNQDNSFEIAYHWETPIPTFTGYISLNDFIYVNTTGIDLGAPYNPYRHEAWYPNPRPK